MSEKVTWLYKIPQPTGENTTAGALRFADHWFETDNFDRASARAEAEKQFGKGGYLFLFIPDSEHPVAEGLSVETQFYRDGNKTL